MVASATSPVAAGAGPSARPDTRVVAASALITIDNFGYSGDLIVTPGQHVNVVNHDDTDHTLTDKQTGLFDTGTVPANGGTGSFTAPTKTGRYPFGCLFHPEMAGTLTVHAPPAPATLTAPHSSTISYGGSVVLSPTLADAKTHKGVAGAKLTLMDRIGSSGTFHTLKTVTTNASGVARTSVSPHVRTQYRWHFSGTLGHLPATSGFGTVTVKQVVHATLTPVTVAVHRTATIYGTVGPSGNGRTVALQRLLAGHWTTLRSSATIHRQTLPNHHVAVGYILHFTPSARGTVTLRVLRAATSANAAGVSSHHDLHVV